MKFQKAVDYFNNLTSAKKKQFVIALVSTCLLLAALPVYAWFAYQKGIVKLQKIESPNSLVLSAAHREDCVNFEINGINAEENVLDGFGNPIYLTDENGNITSNTKKITHKDYVFSVSGSAVDKFTIQLAYTTNNPFTYEIYAAEESLTPPTAVAGVEAEYVAYSVTGKSEKGIPTDLSGDQYHLNAEKDSVLYYTIDKTVSEAADRAQVTNGMYVGRYLNKGANGKATNQYHKDTYEINAAYTNLHEDAEPIYWQATNVSAFPGQVNSNKDPFSRNFILRVKWNENALENTTKETDIVYITVKATG